jgi:tRNA-Thr(GGU) m(6)t(6)A37 methyltransferase TsaA
MRGAELLLTEKEDLRRRLHRMTFELRPIGWIRKNKKRTAIVLYKKYQPALLGVEKLSEIWVLWWFNRDDNPRMRSTLRVHPKGDPANPLRGVFATRAPMRPNLLALSRCKIRSVKNNIITIDEIDALPDTPVLDLKP